MDRRFEAIAHKYRTRLIRQFGSTVAGKTHPHSHVDIAVLLEQPDFSLRDHAELLHGPHALSPFGAKSRL